MAAIPAETPLASAETPGALPKAEGPNNAEAPGIAMTPQEEGIQNWLEGIGLGDIAGLASLLAKLSHGGVDSLGGVKEAELLLSAGKIGLRGIKLRKLMWSLKKLMDPDMVGSPPTERDMSTPSTATGSAFGYLVEKDGPPPLSPRSGKEAATTTTTFPLNTNTVPDVSESSNLMTPPPSQFSARTAAFVAAEYVREGKAQNEAEAAAAAAEAGRNLTPRTFEAVRMSAQSAADEEMAKRLQEELDEAASAAAAAAALAVAKSNPVKSKPSKKKVSAKSTKAKAKSPKSSDRANPSAADTTDGTAAAAGTTAVIKASARLHPHSSGAPSKDVVRFLVDVGDTKFIIDIDKKEKKGEAAKTLLAGIVAPALTGYLVDKPQCVRVPLTSHPEDCIVSVDGEVVDPTLWPAKAYEKADEETYVILIVPDWAKNIIHRTPAAMLDILGQPMPTETPSAPFAITVTGNGRCLFETSKRIKESSLSKPLHDALVLPALQALHHASSKGIDGTPAGVQVYVDGKSVSDKALVSEYVRQDGTAAEVELKLPVALTVEVKHS